MIEIAGLSGNLGSIRRAFGRLGVEYRLVSSERELSGKYPIVLPGVGAFGAVMDAIRGAGLEKGLKKAIASGVPFLGICVGLQLLFDESEESPGVPGLSIISGKVVKFMKGKVPQIGWNRITAKSGSGYPDGHAYFVNSYYAKPDDGSVTLYSANYEGEFCAAIQKDNITAFQFHPEKSLEFGEMLLRRWLGAL